MPFAKLSSLLLLALLASPALSQPVLVTGQPASREFLREVLQARGWSELPPSDLAPGQSFTAPDGRSVINLDWSPPETRLAALSDHPEEVDRQGLLFSGGLSAQRPLRLQYYHLGALAGADPQVVLQMENPGSQPARLHLTRAAGIPSLDYFSTGHGNNVAWFANELDKQGEFFDLAPGESRVVYRQAMPCEHVISGTLGLTQVLGPPLQFGLIALPDAETPVSLNNLLKEGDTHSRGFYPVATHRLQRRHLLGSKEETRIAVGALRQETFSGVRELRGDYGVVYEVEMEIVNSSDRAATATLLLNPRGGAATATFLWDGEVLEVERTDAMKERVLKTVEVPAHSSKLVRLRTIPEGASSYPIRIVIRG